MEGLDRIVAERKRHDELGFTAESDDNYPPGELSSAGLAYLIEAQDQLMLGYDYTPDPTPPPYWPWSDDCWKPSADVVRNMEKGAALIAAEMSRVLRERDDG